MSINIYSQHSVELPCKSRERVVDLNIVKTMKNLWSKGPFKPNPGIAAGFTPFAVPKNRFVDAGSSRRDFAADHKDFMNHAPIPKFDVRGFERSLEDMLTVKDPQSLTDRAWDAVSTFIWPADWFSLAYKQNGTQVFTKVSTPYAKPHPLIEAGIEEPGHFVDRAIKGKKIIYVPDARFEKLFMTSRYYYEMDATGDLGERKIERVDLKEEDYVKFRKYQESYEKAQNKKEPFPLTLIIAPTFLPKEDVTGYYIAGYSELAKFGCDDHQVQEAIVFDITLKYFQMVAQASAMALNGMPQMNKA
jgi:hypothetical protein